MTKLVCVVREQQSCADSLIVSVSGIRHSLLQESSPQAHLNTQARALDMDILGGPDALSLADPVPPLPGYVLSGNV